MVRILAAAALALTLPITAYAAQHGGGMDQMKAEIMNSTDLEGMDIVAIVRPGVSSFQSRPLTVMFSPADPAVMG